MWRSHLGRARSQLPSRRELIRGSTGQARGVARRRDSRVKRTYNTELHRGRVPAQRRRIVKAGLAGKHTQAAGLSWAEIDGSCRRRGDDVRAWWRQEQAHSLQRPPSSDRAGRCAAIHRTGVSGNQSTAKRGVVVFMFVVAVAGAGQDGCSSRLVAVVGGWAAAGAAAAGLCGARERKKHAGWVCAGCGLARRPQAISIGRGVRSRSGCCAIFARPSRAGSTVRG